METLFTTELIDKGKPETFAVSFHHDRYLFKALTADVHFSIRREEDEWHTDEPLDNGLKNAAIDKLETFLLSQH